MLDSVLFHNPVEPWVTLKPLTGGRENSRPLLFTIGISPAGAVCRERPKSAVLSSSRRSRERENPHRGARFAGTYTASAISAQAARRKRGDSPTSAKEPIGTRTARADAAAAMLRSAGEHRFALGQRARADRAGLHPEQARQQGLHAAPKGDVISRAIIAQYGRCEPRY